MTSTVGGFKDRKIESRSKVEPGTFQYIGKYRHGQDVFSTVFGALVASDTAESNSTTSIIAATAHSAKSGDIIQFTSGALSGDIAFVQEVATDTITLSQTLSQSPSGMSFDILKPTTPRVSSSGVVPISGAVDQGAALSVGSAGWLFTEVGTSFLPNFYWNIAGVLEIPTCVIGDPNTGVPWSFINSAGAVHGSTAHDAVDTNYPLKIGGYAASSAPTAVAVGDRVNAWFDLNGRQAVFASTLPQPDTSSATIPSRGKIAAASLTNTYASLLSMGGAAKIIALFNSTDQPVLISLDNGTTDSVELDAYESLTLDLVAAGLTVASSTISAKYVSTAPSVGSVRANVVR